MTLRPIVRLFEFSSGNSVNFRYFARFAREKKCSNLDSYGQKLEKNPNSAKIVRTLAVKVQKSMFLVHGKGKVIQWISI